MSTCSAATFNPEADLQRRRSIDRARALSADIIRQVKDDDNARREPSALEEVLAYGAREVAASAVTFDSAAAALADGSAHRALPQRQRRSNGGRQWVSDADSTAEMLRQLESRRLATFRALEHRSHARASVTRDDQLLAMREYAQACGSLVDALMARITTMPPSTAATLSAHASVVSRHRALALKALTADDEAALDAYDAREAASKRASAVGLAKARIAARGGEAASRHSMSW